MKDDADHPDLQSREYPIREDMAYQLKVWRFERFGWYMLVLLMLLGMFGLFSRGLLSSRDVHSEDGKVRVKYEMFHRNGSMNSMKISVDFRTPRSNWSWQGSFWRALALRRCNLSLCAPGVFPKACACGWRPTPRAKLTCISLCGATDWDCFAAVSLRLVPVA